MFQDGYAQFLDEAMSAPRVLIHVEPQCIWIKGKVVAPVRQRNQLNSRVLMQFLEQAEASSNVKM